MTYTAPIFQMNEVSNVVALCLTLAFLIAADVFLFLLFKRTFARVSLIVGETSLVLSWLFGLSLFTIILGVGLCALVTIYFSANLSDFRTLIGNGLQAPGKKSWFSFLHREKAAPEALFDREAMYRKIETAVITMSKQKVGAIISFERKNPMDEIMKSGTIINAPVSAELLQTIFYPGTRLHDGAVVIRNDQIVAASVYFTPTTRPLTGKYGSRHRAAIGISETVDAVTVVVSEETGRISIAYQGELRTLSPDEFLPAFINYMSLDSEEQNKQ